MTKAAGSANEFQNRQQNELENSGNFAKKVLPRHTPHYTKRPRARKLREKKSRKKASLMRGLVRLICQSVAGHVAVQQHPHPPLAAPSTAAPSSPTLCVNIMLATKAAHSIFRLSFSPYKYA